MLGSFFMLSRSFNPIDGFLFYDRSYTSVSTAIQGHVVRLVGFPCAACEIRHINGFGTFINV